MRANVNTGIHGADGWKKMVHSLTIEADKTKAISITLPVGLIADVDHQAQLDDRTRSTWIRRVLCKELYGNPVGPANNGARSAGNGRNKGRRAQP